MNQQKPTGYDELIGVLDSLPVIVREKRRREGLSLRAAAAQVGVSFSTLCRIEQGTWDERMSSVVAALRWAAS